MTTRSNFVKIMGFCKAVAANPCTSKAVVWHGLIIDLLDTYFPLKGNLSYGEKLRMLRR